MAALAEETFRFPRVDPSDPVGSKFHWVSNSEPHMVRRRELLAKYGDQIRKLYGYDHATAWVVRCVGPQLRRGGGVWRLRCRGVCMAGTDSCDVTRRRRSPPAPWP